MLDLSASGMRIRCAGKPPVKRGASDQFAIRSGSQQLSVLGKVVWVKRGTWRSRTWEFGVRFTDPRPGLRTALSNLAQYGFVSGAAVADTSTGAGPSPAPDPSGGAKAKSGVSAGIEVDDLYKVLGVGRGATEDEVRTAYRGLARTLHPDVCSDPGAPERFTHIGRAYAVLKDPKERKRYDDLLARLGTAA